MYPERELCKDIKRLLNYLKQQGVVSFYHRTTTGLFLQRPGTFIQCGFKGLPDFIGMFTTGRFFCIEAKSPKGKTRPEQQIFIDQINLDGGLAIIARCLDDIIKNPDFHC
jgi:VRR-NUC domain